MFIATVIAAQRLDENALRAAGDALAAAGCEPAPPRWIDAGDAADIAFAARPDAARGALRTIADDIDSVVQPARHREKRLLVSDMDSTMIGQECIDELADFVGQRDAVAAITARAMRGEIAFAAALAERVALLDGLPVSRIAECLATRITDTPGAATLVRTMNARGATTILVSGGFRRFAGPVAQRLGFDRVHCNVLATRDNRLTGAVEPPILDAEGKRAVLEDARRELALDVAETLAIGDGANDLPMIAAAGLGVGYHAKPALADAADAVIAHHDLASLLWVQGIPRAEWSAV